MTLATAVRAETRPAVRLARHRTSAWPWSRVAALVAVAVVVVLLCIDLNGAPYFESDEGTYVAQAQSVLHLAGLAPYTYFYDHPPGGWLQLAVWLGLTGDGAFTGGALNDARILMVIVQAVSLLLVIRIGHRLTGSVWAGIVAALLFGLSPYAFFYHRRVLLDNFAALWMLVSLALLLSRRLTLSRVVLAALAIGVAFWSKEVAITFVPAFGLLAMRRTPRESRAFVLGGWFAVSGGVISLYVLMALLNGELFAQGTMLGGAKPHVSLLCTLQWQSGRNSDGGLLQAGSGFWNEAVAWAGADPVLVIGGSIASLAALLWWRRDAALASIGLALVCLWLFLGRGGVTLAFYLVPLIPFLALALVGVVWHLGRALSAAGGARRRIARAGALGAAVLAAGAVALDVVSIASSGLWTTDPTVGQAQAEAWVQQHLPPSSRIVIDMNMYPALHAPAPSDGRSFADAEYYWRAADDPAVLKTVFDGRWQNVDYVVVTPQVLHDAAGGTIPFVVDALDHSTVVKSFDTGLPVEVRKVSPTGKSVSLFGSPSGGVAAAVPTSCMTAGG